MAGSPDGVPWTEMGPVLTIDEGKSRIATGTTWRNPVPGGNPSFQINYSCLGAERQTILFSQSEYLIS